MHRERLLDDSHYKWETLLFSVRDVLSFRGSSSIFSLFLSSIRSIIGSKSNRAGKVSMTRDDGGRSTRGGGGR